MGVLGRKPDLHWKLTNLVRHIGCSYGSRTHYHEGMNLVWLSVSLNCNIVVLEKEKGCNSRTEEILTYVFCSHTVVFIRSVVRFAVAMLDFLLVIYLLVMTEGLEPTHVRMKTWCVKPLHHATITRPLVTQFRLCAHLLCFLTRGIRLSGSCSSNYFLSLSTYYIYIIQYHHFLWYPSNHHL